jgi:hypothetical protein
MMFTPTDTTDYKTAMGKAHAIAAAASSRAIVIPARNGSRAARSIVELGSHESPQTHPSVFLSVAQQFGEREPHHISRVRPVEIPRRVQRFDAGDGGPGVEAFVLMAVLMKACAAWRAAGA